MQSNPSNRAGLHVAIIMDGNGRWATRRGLPRAAGHRAGAATVSRMTEAAPALGITTLTLFAFSADNWRRPAPEVATLMWLLRVYLRRAVARLAERGVRLSFIGRRDRLAALLRDEIEYAETETARGRRLHLRIAVDYSSREAITDALARCAPDMPATPEARTKRIEAALAEMQGAAAVDLLIRTGGEQRLSDFLLWECAYAELWFTDTMWPDFDAAMLARSLADFHRRERRFGGLPTDTRLLGAAE
jgi:undecaprenyl diphosphate synthase